MSRGDGLHPAALAIGAFLTTVAVTVLVALPRTGGELVYAIDDAYIHLSMAQSIAGHGVFGVTPHAFTASSSSPLWTLLLAGAFWLTGPWTWWPLLLNLAAGAGAILAADALLRAQLSPRARTWTLLGMVLLAPLPAVALTGMEHLLHLWLVLLLARACLAAAPRLGVIAVLAGLCVATRLESLFAIGPLAVAAWLRGNPRGALAALLGAALPVLALGSWQLAHGWFFLPTSVVLKSSLADDPIPGLRAHGGLRQLFTHEHLTAILGAGLLALSQALRQTLRRSPSPAPSAATAQPASQLQPHRISVDDPAILQAAAALIALLLHGSFARFGWFYRYEAWLVAWAVVAIAILVARCRAPGTRRWPLALLTFVAVGLAMPRAARALRDPPTAMRHTWLQPDLVARFLAANFPDVPVALNDLGAVAFRSRTTITDLVGLADLDIAKARLAGRCDADYLASLCRARGVGIAVVYADWFGHGLPAAWRPVATWTVSGAFWGEQVTWLAVDPAIADRLQAGALAPPGGLPAGVVARPAR